MENRYQSFLAKEAYYLMGLGTNLKTLIRGSYPYIIDSYYMRNIHYTHFSALDNILGRKYTMFLFDLEDKE